MRESSTFREVKANIHRRSYWLLAAWIVLGFARTAYAIDPNRSMSQYMRDAWTRENGFPGGQVNAIAQTADGYLWLGAEKGLFRFDGRNFLDIQQLNPASPRINHVLDLAVETDGDLWIRTEGPSVLRYHDGKFDTLVSDIGSRESSVTAMARTNEGGMVISTLPRGLLLYHKEKPEVVASANALSASVILSLAQTSDGRFWVGTRDDGLFYLNHGTPVIVAEGLPDRKINCLLPAKNNRLWIGTDNGMALWDGSRIAEDAIPPLLTHIQVLSMTEDRDGNLWIGTAHGLLRFNTRGVSSMPAQNPESDKQVTALFEDREGNLWTGNTEGLERLRDGAFATYATADGLPSNSNGPIYVDPDERTWVAPSKGGLYSIGNEKVGHVTREGLDQDIVYSISGDKDELWIGRQRGGLTRLRLQAGDFTAQTYTTRQGLAQNSVYSVHENRDGTVWAGTLNGGVSRFKNGQFTTYTYSDGLASNTITAIEEGLNNTMWFATPGGLSALSNDHWHTLTQKDGLPSDDVVCLLLDSEGVLWIGTGNGLAAVAADHVIPLHNMPKPLYEPVFGLEEDRSGSFWIATSSHVIRVNRQKLLHGQLRNEEVHEYGPVDGLYGNEGVRRNRSVVRDRQGRIWFSLNRGVSVVDPGRIKDNSAPAITHIEAILADGNPINLQAPIHIPASQQRIVFDYIGLSLTIPDRVRYRYKLEGFDRNWSEPVAAQQAIYTNLGPGPYQFRVEASNSYGQWNGTEATLPFRIQPAFWQTLWFQCLCLLALAFVVWVFYRLRLRQVARQLNVRFEERLAERMRIAQELHDTLLQGLLSASMQLHVAVDQTPEKSTVKPLLKRVLQLMGQVIDEGRNALRGLRTSSQVTANLEQAFSHVPQELAILQDIPYRVIVNGQPRSLHPMIRDEVYRIGREALVNAFRHAQAGSIELEVQYTASYLRILIRDDGCGIDPHVLRSGREGHWGLPGMRERAEGIGARFKVWSRSAAGTEVELIVPGNVAYKDPPGRGRLTRLYSQRTQKNGVNSEQEK